MRFSVPRGGTPTIDQAGTWVRAEGGDLPHPVTVRLQVADDGRLQVTGMLIEAEPELTAQDLRLSLPQVVAGFSAAMSNPQTLKRLFRELLGIELIIEGDNPSEELPPAWRELLLPGATDTPRRIRPGPRGHDDAFYEEVARDYRRAQREQPQRPIQALMEWRGYSEPATHRQLREARKRGLLPPATKGKKR
jgi:hypothetical protein